MASQDNIACSCTSLKNSIASVIITVNCNYIIQILQKKKIHVQGRPKVNLTICGLDLTKPQKLTQEVSIIKAL